VGQLQVFIGSDPAALDGLVATLKDCLLAREPLTLDQRAAIAARSELAAMLLEDERFTEVGPHPTPPLTPCSTPLIGTLLNDEPCHLLSSQDHIGIAQVAPRGTQHHPETGQNSRSGVADSLEDTVFEFSVQSSPLHGLVGSEVNAAVMSAVNSASFGKGLFLFGRRVAGSISASTAMQRVDRCV
jgi:hypothetical protein